MTRAHLAVVLALAACSETAWNTTIADTPDRRLAMAASVEVGKTTETEFITRWGAPTQRVREGGQTEFIYRNMSNPAGYIAPRFGDSASYVIVTFQYGRAVGVRTSETEGCRATFAPVPPGYGWPNPTTVHPAATCPGVGPLQGRVHPVEQALRQFTDAVDGAAGSLGSSETAPGVREDAYRGGGKAD
ncbi:MAG: hypothetical protein QNJ13_13885 [Paracoccaceae bacterium]|nr:hypothetical protein [Paracoccaceae bacterium]